MFFIFLFNTLHIFNLFKISSWKMGFMKVLGVGQNMIYDEGGRGVIQFLIFSDKGGRGVIQFLIFSDEGGLSVNKHAELAKYLLFFSNYDTFST